jgi:hypothetical protein
VAVRPRAHLPPSAAIRRRPPHWAPLCASGDSPKGAGAYGWDGESGGRERGLAGLGAGPEMADLLGRTLTGSRFQTRRHGPCNPWAEEGRWIRVPCAREAP